MAFVKSSNKVDATKALVNTWLKDPTMYCNHCGMDYHPDLVDTGEGVYNQLCCENPQIGRNIDHTKGIVAQNKEISSSLSKSTGANETDSMRFGLSIPPRLYTSLKTYFEKHGEKFLDNPKELHQFMRAFPQFCIPKSI